MALNLRFKIPTSTSLEHLFSKWFWLILLVLWLGVLSWLGLFVKKTLQSEAVNPQLLSAKEVRIDQQTLTSLNTLFDARAKRAAATGASADRFTPGP